MALRYTTKAYFEQVKHKYINKIWHGNKENQISCVLDIRDRIYQKAFSLFGTEAGNQKKFSDCLLTRIQSIPVRKYTGTGIPAHACPWKILDF